MAENAARQDRVRLAGMVPGGHEDLKLLQARMRGEVPTIGTAGVTRLVNYASAPLGAKKYDSSVLGAP